MILTSPISIVINDTSDDSIWFNICCDRLTENTSDDLTKFNNSNRTSIRDLSMDGYMNKVLALRVGVS